MAGPQPQSRMADKQLIDPDRALKNPLIRTGFKLLRPALEPLLRYQDFNDTYTRAARGWEAGKSNPFEMALEALGISYSVRDEDIERIPRSGPVVLVSNHPFGGLDGVVMGAILTKIRPDVRLLVNYLLGELELLRDHIIEVDPFGRAESAKSNLKGLRECLRFLKGGGLLATWPSGTVSHLHVRRMRVMDPPWVPHIAALIQRSGATVVPAYFPGRNGNFFQVAGLVHPLLRTALLPGEMMRNRGAELEVRIGSPITPGRNARFESPEELSDFLRLKTYILQNRHIAEKTSFLRLPRRRRSHEAPIAPEKSAEHLQREIDALPAAQKLLEHGEYDVFFADANQIPQLLEHIGTLRELTFRAVGEGTGMARDLDRFDHHYKHLFAWNREEQEFVGAYRLGLSGEILDRFGAGGFYTTTLFRYSPGVLEQISPAVELGRSFIVEKYQRKHLSLGLLWRGIGQFIVKHPEYKTLFGPVTISQDYQSLSKDLMVMFLKENSLDPEFSRLVRAKKPPRSHRFGSLDRSSFNRTVHDIEDVSALVSEIEREEKGVPVLLRQYLKLNATILSFNVDPGFNNCIDGLVLVDLTKTNEKTLRRYMGEEGLRQFYAWHELRLAEQQVLREDD